MNHVLTRDETLGHMSDALAAVGSIRERLQEFRVMNGEGDLEHLLEERTFKVRELKPRAVRGQGDHA